MLRCRWLLLKPMNSIAVKAILLLFFLSRISKRKDRESPLTFWNSNDCFNSMHDLFLRSGPDPDTAQPLMSSFKPEILHSDTHIHMEKLRRGKIGICTIYRDNGYWCIFDAHGILADMREFLQHILICDDVEFPRLLVMSGRCLHGSTEHG